MTLPSESTRRTSIPTIAPGTCGGVTFTESNSVAYGPSLNGPDRWTYVVSDGSAWCSGTGGVICACAAGARASSSATTAKNRTICDPLVNTMGRTGAPPRWTATLMRSG